MKCIIIFVGLLAILAMVQAEDDAVETPSSESDSEPAPPAEETQLNESENDHQHHAHDEHGHPEGKPPKPNQVGFDIGLSLHIGK